MVHTKLSVCNLSLTPKTQRENVWKVFLFEGIYAELESLYFMDRM